VRAATALGLLSLSLAIAATALVLQGQDARARLVEENDRLLTERAAEAESFAGRVAHDLRDPLNTVGLRLAALQQQRDLDNHVRGQLDKVRAQLTRMRLVIDGLLEFARSGARPPAGARADLAEVLDEVLLSMRPAAEAAQAELWIGPITDVPLAVAPEALSSVLTNLLGNAVKYVGEGQQLPHRIGVRASQSARLARIEVEDNGPGLPPGTEDRVFEPFRRLPSHQPGTGLGLATVKRIVEAYQGRVGVYAEPGRGSTFWVEIPCSEPPAPVTRTVSDRAREA
jgi:signal transduction histidine kinase